MGGEDEDALGRKETNRERKAERKGGQYGDGGSAHRMIKMSDG